jgi:hypothetical protein
MTDPTNFWTEATPRRNGWMDRAARRADAWHAARQPEPEPEPVAPDMVAGLDLQQYAAQRAALGVRSASEFVGINRPDDGSGFPSAGDRSFTKEQREALPDLAARTHDRPGYEPRQRGIDASLVESIGGIRGRGTIQNTTK